MRLVLSCCLQVFTYGAARLSSIDTPPLLADCSPARSGMRSRRLATAWLAILAVKRALRGIHSVYGTIKKVMKDKGFGFIVPDDGSEDIFFHRSRLSPKVYFEDLREGTEVQFDVRPGEKGRQAFNVRIR